MSDTKNTENESSGLKKSLRLIYVYAIAAGAIFTFIGYWDTIFYEYCGAGTFLGFILMTLLILPIAMVYCELAPLFPRAGGELIYNTVGINKHIGFFSSWLIMQHGSQFRRLQLWLLSSGCSMYFISKAVSFLSKELLWQLLLVIVP